MQRKPRSPIYQGDSLRDALRYRCLVSELVNVSDVLRQDPNGSMDIDEAFSRLLSRLCEALNGEKAFIAEMKPGIPDGEPLLEITAAYPSSEQNHQRLAWTPLFMRLRNQQRSIVVDRLLDEKQMLIGGLDLFGATTAVVVRTEVVGKIRFIGICNRRKSSLGPFLAADRMILESLTDLITFGIEIGERRRQELEQLQKTALSISAEQTLEELLPEITRHAGQVFHSPVSLMLWDDDHKQMIIKAKNDLSDNYKVDQAISNERVAIGRLQMGSALSMIIPDLRSAGFGDPQLIEREGLFSSLTAQLQVSGNLLGILNIYSKSPERKFDQREKELAEIFASQAAIAIRNASLRKRVSEDIAQATKLIKTALDIESLAEFLVTEVSQVLHADAAGLALWKDNTQPVTFAHTYGLSEHFKGVWRSTVDEIRERTFHGNFNQPIIISDLLSEPFGPEALLRSDDLSSALIAPLVNAEKVVGILVVFGKGSTRRFGPVDLELAQIFVNQAVQAFQTATAFLEVRDTRDELKRTLETVSVIAYAATLEDGLSALAGHLVDWLKVTFCHIFIFDEIEQMLTKGAAFPVGRSRPLDWNPDQNPVINLDNAPNMRYLVRLEEPTVFKQGDMVGDKEILRHLEVNLSLKGKLNQALIFPLTMDEKVLGICTLGEMRVRPGYVFDQEKIYKAVSMASQAVPLILRLKMQLAREKRAFQEDQLRKSGERITQNANLELSDLTNLIAEMACNILGAQCAVVYPYYNQLGVYDVLTIGTYGLFHRKSILNTEIYGEPDGITNFIINYQPHMVVDDVSHGWSRNNTFQIDVKNDRFFNKENARAFVGLRLQIEQEPVGAMFVFFREPHHFYRAELDVIEIFASQAAVALHQARILQRGKKEHYAINAMVDITQMINVKPSPSSILVRILKGALDITGHRGHSEIVLLTPDGNSFKVIAQKGNPRVQKGVLRLSTVFQGFMHKKTAHLVLDTQLESSMQDIGDKRENGRPVRSFLAAPFSSNGREDPDSLLVLESPFPAAYSPDDRDILEELAAFAGIALQSTSRYKELRDNSLLQSSLLKASRDIATLEESKKILQNIVDSTQTALRCDLVTLHTYDKDSRLLNPGPITAGELFHPEKLILNRFTLNRTIASKLVISGRVHFSDDVEKDFQLADSKFVKNEKIKSSGGIPLIIGDERLGILYVNFRQPHKFLGSEKKIFKLFAGQAAIALHNAQMFNRLKAHNHHMLKVHDASKLIIQRISAGRDQLLTGVLKEAVETVTGALGEKATIGTIQICKNNTLVIESFYPKEQPSEVLAGLREALPLMPPRMGGKKQGITVRAFRSGKPVLVSDVGVENDYHEFCPETKSELAVPLIDNGRVIGVLNVESNRPNNFDEDDQYALIALADLAVIALHNAERNEQLTRANTVAIMGAWGADVVHDINREVGNIRLAVKLITMRKNVGDEVIDRLNQIDTYAEAMRQPELTDKRDLSYQGNIKRSESIKDVDTIISQAVANLEVQIDNADLHFYGASQGHQVLMDEQWIARILRHLVVNATREAVRKQEMVDRPQITIRTNLMEGMVEVQVEDNGPGVPPDYVPRIFNEPLPSNGQGGRGLLLVQFLVEHHGGKIRLAWSKPGEGACFAFTLLPWKQDPS